MLCFDDEIKNCIWIQAIHSQTHSILLLAFPTACENSAHLPGAAYMHCVDGSHLIRNCHVGNIMKQDKFDKIGPYFNIAYKYTTCKLTREQSG